MPSDQKPPIERDDLAVTLAVREDLGPAHDDAVIGEFLDRVGHSIDARVDDRMGASSRQASHQPAQNRSAALGFASIGMGIPITAIALGTTSGGPSGVIAMIVAWGGIAAVNFAHTRPRR